MECAGYGEDASRQSIVHIKWAIEFDYDDSACEQRGLSNQWRWLSWSPREVVAGGAFFLAKRPDLL